MDFGIRYNPSSILALQFINYLTLDQLPNSSPSLYTLNSVPFLFGSLFYTQYLIYNRQSKIFFE
jgi:hypothetical protein